MFPIVAALPALTSALGATGGGAAAATGGGAALSNLLPMLGKGGGDNGGGLFSALGGGMGGTFGMGTAILQGIQGRKSKNAADALQPALYDPLQLAMFDEIDERRKSLLTGSAFASQMGAIDQSQAGVNRAIVSSTGGDVSATLQGLLSSQTNADRAKNQVLAQSDELGTFYSNLGANLMKDISARSLQLQLAQQGQQRAQWAQSSQDAYANAANAVSRFQPDQILDILQREKVAAVSAPMQGQMAPAQNTGIQNPIQNILSSDSGMGEAKEPGLVQAAMASPDVSFDILQNAFLK